MKAEQLPNEAACMVLREGLPPPQPGYTRWLSERDMLISAAWAYGMTERDVVHRDALFYFIQSHIVSKQREPLQRAIETSEDWESAGSRTGRYRLSRKGAERLDERGPIPARVDTRVWYCSGKVFNGETFAVLINGGGRSILCFRNCQGIDSADILRYLAQCQPKLSPPGSSKRDKVVNWVLVSAFPGYVWTRSETTYDQHTAPARCFEVLDRQLRQGIVNPAAYAESEGEWRREEARRQQAQEYLDALAGTEERSEGKKVLRFTAYYERDPKLRADAIRWHGAQCVVCGFDFAAFYGPLAEGFIEVHHTKPVSELGEVTLVNPVTDMVVLCSNCHSIIHHKKNSVRSVDDLKKMTASQSKRARK